MDDNSITEWFKEIEERLEILEQAIRETNAVAFEYKGMHCEACLGDFTFGIRYTGSYEGNNTFRAFFGYSSREEVIAMIKEAIDKEEQEASSNDV